MQTLFSQRKSQHYGFSLIELLIAVSIIAFVGMVLYTTFSQGMRVWRRAVDMQPDFVSDLIFEKIERDLANAFEAGFRPLRREGDVLQFFSHSVYGKNDGSARRMPVRITYQFDKSLGVLTREEERYPELLTAILREPSAGRIEAEHMQSVQFEYYHQNPDGEAFLWKPFWRGGCLPEAVRISIQMDGSKQGLRAVKILPVPAGLAVCALDSTAASAVSSTLPGAAAIV